MASESKEKSLHQFISHFRQHRNRENDPFYFGEEIEYMIIKIDSEKKTADVLPKSLTLLDKLWQHPIHTLVWKPEYTSYMVESSPERPYHGLITSPLDIEQDMKNRRRDVQAIMSDKEHLLTIASFPRLGTVDVSNCDSTNVHPDDMVTNYPRYQRLKCCTKRVIQRKVDVRVPVFRESKCIPGGMPTNKADQDIIVMDSSTYGLGCCSLQVTMQAPDLPACMTLYDQLVNIAPVMLALSAASPIHKGYLANIDSRWKILTELPISRIVEKSENNNITGYGRLHRFESVHCYACPDNQQLNDVDVDFDERTFQRLKEEDCYPGFALYIANLFSRTPLGLTSDNDDINLRHYLNIQNSNWQTVRMKVPSNTAGWTVEFRPMDVQLTEFENTAYVVFVMLLAKVLMEFKLTLTVPISKVNENMEKASVVDAVRTELFYTPRSLFTANTPEDVVVSVTQGIMYPNELNYTSASKNRIRCTEKHREKTFDYFSVKDIICGGAGFVGFLPIIRHYLITNNLTGYDKYLKLIEDRAKGTVPTTARAIRDFVLSHTCYNNDSKVTEQVQYDLVQIMAKHTVQNTVMGSKTEM